LLVNPLRPVSCLLTFVWLLGSASTVGAQDAAQPTDKTPSQTPTEKDKSLHKPELPFQIELLETQVRFAKNGDSHKEVHTIVKIINILGAHQFSRISFDYNRAYQQVEIPLVRVRHANGGTSEVLPGAVSDAPNAAAQPFPTYHDVRVKAVRILGLQEGDTVEYRVITTTTKHPLAPDFWFQHTFDKTGIVLRESLTLHLPPARGHVQVNPETPAERVHEPDGGSSYHWDRKQEAGTSQRAAEEAKAKPDVTVSTFATEVEFMQRLVPVFYQETKPSAVVSAKARELTKQTENDAQALRKLYAFVSQNIATVDLPMGATGFASRRPEEILQAGGGVPEDKAALLIALVAGVSNYRPTACLAFKNAPEPPFYELPTQVQHILLGVAEGVFGKPVWMDPAVEVAPFGMISSNYRGKSVLCVPHSETEHGLSVWEQVPDALPFAASQQVNVDAQLNESGDLTAKVKYALRGDNELLLRLAFHQTAKDKWREVASLLAISDGFRGQITNVNVSDPLETANPFSVEYELKQPKFVDWSKKPVRIPALLPQIGLPDATPAGAPGLAGPQIDLGTPLEVQTTMTLHLPAGTSVETPPGTSVSRDYATFTSKYASTQNHATASRHVNFLKREIPAARALDYSAFVHAVQNDQAQRFSMVPPSAADEKATPAGKP
jgi:Domain of Unknown Function with PDB structure (DUF3857)